MHFIFNKNTMKLNLFLTTIAYFVLGITTATMYREQILKLSPEFLSLTYVLGGLFFILITITKFKKLLDFISEKENINEIKLKKEKLNDNNITNSAA